MLDQRESLRTLLGLTPEIVDKVKKAVVKTFGTKLPSVESKEFRKALQNAFRVELKKLITDYIGKTNENIQVDDDITVKINPYKLFLEEQGKLVYGIISQQNINKRYWSPRGSF